MKEKVLLALIFIFAVLFGLGFTCLEYKLFNLAANILLILIGLLGFIVTLYIFYKSYIVK